MARSAWSARNTPGARPPWEYTPAPDGATGMARRYCQSCHKNTYPVSYLMVPPDYPPDRKNCQGCIEDWEAERRAKEFTERMKRQSLLVEWH